MVTCHNIATCNDACCRAAGGHELPGPRQRWRHLLRALPGLLRGPAVRILPSIRNIVAKNCKFYVILLVSRPSGEEVTAEAIKSIIQAVNYTLPLPLIKSNMLLSGTHVYLSPCKKQYFFISPCLYPCLDYFPLSAHSTKNIFTKHSQSSQTRNLLLLQNWTFTSFVRLRKREWNHKDYNLKFYFKTIMWSGFQISIKILLDR